MHTSFVLALLAMAGPRFAQSPSAPRMPTAPADSARVARDAWARAVAAMQEKDITAARREVERAARAWPTQEAYAWARVVLAARATDTIAVVSTLNSYADLGLGRDLLREPSLAAFALLPALAPLIARHDANRAPIVHSIARATFADTTFWPEGVDYDPRTHSYYVASVRHGTIAELRADRPPRELIAHHTKGIGAILGVRVDTARGVLWATTAGIPQMAGYAAADATIAALLRIRISDGHIERRYDLAPSRNGHTLGDLAIDAHGTVYVTDSRDPVLYTLQANSDSLVALRNPLFRSLQGVTPTPDGRTLYVADYSHGILRIDLATHAVIRVADAPRSTSLGCDGIAWYLGTIVAVQNGVTPPRVMQFTLSDSGTRFSRADVIDRNTTMADEPTIGTIVGRDFVYVATSQWEKHDDTGARIPAAHLRPPTLLAVRLRP